MKNTIDLYGIDMDNDSYNTYQTHDLNKTYVKERRLANNKAKLYLKNKDILLTRRYIPVSKQNYIAYNKEHLYVYLKNEKKWIPVTPAWKKTYHVDIGDLKVSITFKEIETEEELKQYKTLEKFHYRGGGGAGRIVPLIGFTEKWDMPHVLGFIELSSCMIANTARRNAFDAPFQDIDIGWYKWDRETSSKYSKIICRVSRFVIHPEVRNLNLTSKFLNAAKEYAKYRWHYGEMKPRFLEITADMLRFYNFLQHSDFLYLGETQGNEHRLTKDMRYLVTKSLSEDGKDAMPKGGGGIMSLQRGYAMKILKYMNTKDISLHKIIEDLQLEPGKLDQDMWEQLHGVVRRPKPTYAMGLTDNAHNFLKDRYEKLFQSDKKIDKRSQNDISCITIKNIQVHARSSISQTTQARLLQDAFGFVGQEFSQEIVSCDGFKIKSGEITFVCGASGSGKSLFLEAISSIIENRRKNFKDIYIQGESDLHSKVTKLPELSAEKTPLDYMGQYNFEEIFSICSKCGLAEPQLFVRNIKTLSSGQYYRLQIALAFLMKPNLICIDNFCEPLDRFTTIAVCNGLKKLAKYINTAIIISSSAYERIRTNLEFDQEIILRRSTKATCKRCLEW